jgi:hypothetical protein
MSLSTVGDSAIKMACLQVKPGHEFEVVSSLVDAFDDHVNYSIKKGFGHYDIILFYEGENFEYHLTDCGPIQGILSSITFLCFPYLGSSSSEIFKKINASLFVGVSLIKYNTSPGCDVEEIEKKLYEYCQDEKTIDQEFLGTIGWNEIIILLFSDNVQEVARDLLKLNYDNTLDCFIEKTYSSIGIQHSFLPDCEGKKFVDIEKQFLATDSLSCKLDGSVPSIKISSKPRHYKAIKSFWEQHSFDAREILGAYDIACEPKDPNNHTWANLLACLLFFRHSFKEKIKSTFTSLEIKDSTLYQPAPPSQPAADTEKTDGTNRYGQGDFTEFQFKDLDVFGPTAGLLANHFYTLNSLRQYPISGKAFCDMGYYIEAIINLGIWLGKKNKEKESASGDKKLSSLMLKPLEDIVMSASYAIASGCQLRSYGIYGNIERPHGGFSRLRGGGQRALAATQFFPHYILHELGYNWDGFIIVEEAKFSHINEVIAVPSEAFWRPSSWWAILHETGHVFLTKCTWITKTDPVVRNILINKNNPEIWFEFLLELGAEIFSFEIGFFDDFELYRTVLLEYLVDIEPTQKKHFDMSVYLLRTFFVEIYSKIFKEQSIGEEEFENEKNLFDLALSHIDRAIIIIDARIVENSSPEDEYSPFDIQNKHFLAASLAVTIRELSSFSKYLNDKIVTFYDDATEPENSNRLFEYNKNAYDKKDIKDVTDSIVNGSVWWGEIENPIAVLYSLVVLRKDMRFCSSIAAVITFWNQANK